MVTGFLAVLGRISVRVTVKFTVKFHSSGWVFFARYSVMVLVKVHHIVTLKVILKVTLKVILKVSF